MDENIVDTLKIEIVGDSGKAVDSIGKLISTLEKIKGATSGSNKGLNSVQKNLNKIALAVDKINAGSVSKIHELSESLKKLDGIKISGKLADRILDIGAAVNSLKDVDFGRLTSLNSGLQAIGGVGDVSAPNISTTSTPISNSPFDRDIPITPVAFEDVSNKVGELNSKLEETASKVDDLGNKATSSVKKVKKALDSLTGKSTKSFGKIISKYTRLLTLFGKRATYRALNAVIDMITKSFKDGIDAVYQYSKALNGTFAKSLDTIATSFNYLKGSLGAMSAPLLNMLAPAIELLVDKFVDLLNIANQVFARLSGATTWTKATKVATEYAQATDAATAANKALKKSILGIDELNVLTDNSSNSSGAGASNTSNFAFEEVPLDTSYVDGVIDKLKDILRIVGAIGLVVKGWQFGKALGEVLKTIPALKDMNVLSFAGGLALTVASLTIMVKGAIDIISNGIDGKNFAEMLGSGGGLVGGGALIGKAFGSALIGSAIGMIVAGVGTAFVGIWSAIEEGLNWLNGLLIPAGTTLVGTGVGLLIGSAAGPIGALIGLAAGALTDLIILVVQNWDAISARCSEALSNIGQFFVDLWQGVADVWNVCAEWFNINVIQPVADFFAGLWNGISEAASSCWNAIVEFFSPAIGWFSELFGSIWQTISDIFYDIGVIASGCWEIIKRVWEIVSTWFNTNVIQPVANLFVGLWTNVKNWAIGAWDSIKSVFSTIGGWINRVVIQPVANFFTGLWNGFISNAEAAWQGVKKVFGTVAVFFRETFEKAWKGIVGVFSVAGEIFNDIKDGVVTAFKTVVNGLIKGINKVVAVPFKGINTALEKLRDIKILDLQPFSGLKTINIPEIPLLASGGMVNAGTAFIAGEAGAEVVANIGNRTGVMNTDEMRESVALGISDANAEQNALLREQNRILRELLERDDNSGGGAYGSLIGGIARKNRRDGKTVIPLGV